MIDLIRPLPHSIDAEGGTVLVHTGHRVWLGFGEVLRDYGICSPHVLKEEPCGEWRQGALDFYLAKVATPRGGDGARVFDMALDADYIVGAFAQAYGIDLTDPDTDLHWWHFLALLRSVPQGTRLADIMRWRSWTRADERRKPEAAHQELHDRWALPAVQDASRLDIQQRLFGGVTGG